MGLKLKTDRRDDLGDDLAASIVPDIESFNEAERWLDEHLQNEPLVKAKLKEFIQKQNNTISVLTRNFEELRGRKETFKKARLDWLTKLPPPGEFVKNLSIHFEKENRDHVCAIILFDVSHFKKINDTFLHSMGDLVIIRVAQEIRSGTRSEESLGSQELEHRRKSRIPTRFDLITRLGGDEFAVCVLLNFDPKESREEYEQAVLRIADRCCIRFENVQWATEYKKWAKMLKKKPEGASIKPTLNPGVVIIHAGSLPRIRQGSGSAVVHRILTVADACMFESKDHEKEFGRRRIFYNTAEFHNLQLVVHPRCYYDPPSAARE